VASAKRALESFSELTVLMCFYANLLKRPDYTAKLMDHEFKGRHDFAAICLAKIVPAVFFLIDRLFLSLCARA
jgi:hypothetical protein